MSTSREHEAVAARLTRRRRKTALDVPEHTNRRAPKPDPSRTASGTLAEEVRSLVERADRVAGRAPLAASIDRHLRHALAAGLIDREALLDAMVDEACGGPSLSAFVTPLLADRRTVVVEAPRSEDVARVLRARGLGGPRPVGSPKAHLTGKRLGRYAVGGLLGAGGMGEVYSVVDGELEREVALKVIRGEADARHLRAFVLEARVTGKLQHPSIVPVHELGQTSEGRLYFTMKKVEGRTLSAMLRDEVPAPFPEGGPTQRAVAPTRSALGVAESSQGATSAHRGRLPTPPAAVVADARPPRRDHRPIELVAVMMKVCEAIAFAHSKGVVHRDLKPDNVLIGAFGEVLVCDWGLAKVMTERGGHAPTDGALVAPLGGESTLDGEVKGTPAYMPPEQAQGHAHDVDERADIYALGAMLYEVLSGEPPYVGRSAQDVLAQVVAGPPTPLATRAPERQIPWELEAIVGRAMDRDPARRYASVAALRGDLAAFLGGRLVEAARYSLFARVLKLGRRHARAVAAIAFAAASSMVALAYVAVSSRAQVQVVLEEQQLARAAEESAQREARNARDAERTARQEAAKSLAAGETAQREAARAREAEQVSQQQARAASEARDAARVAELSAQREASEASRARDAARASYEEARRMGAVQKLRRLEEASVELGWTRLDERTGRLRDQADEQRIAAALEEIVAWRAELDQLLAETATIADVATAAARDAAASPDDAWLAFRARVFGELSVGRLRLSALAKDVDARHRACSEVVRRHAELAASWKSATTAIAASPRYNGLVLAPQLGLVPLGPDPRTGLWLFAVLGTGRVPGNPSEIADDTAIVLVLIPGGQYRIGATVGDDGDHVDPEATPNEGPVHSVRLRPFFIGRTELTQHQWAAIAGPPPSRYPMGETVEARKVSGRHPVENLSWEEFARGLARVGLVLPSEVQWEAAARGGSRTPYWIGREPPALAATDNVADALCKRFVKDVGECEAWNDGHFIHAPVASYRKGSNPFGLFDVHGNVKEWCRDPFDADAPHATFSDEHGDRERPRDVARAIIVRGGSWDDPASEARASRRDGDARASHDGTTGARPSRAVMP